MGNFQSNNRHRHPSQNENNNGTNESNEDNTNATSNEISGPINSNGIRYNLRQTVGRLIRRRNSDSEVADSSHPRSLQRRLRRSSTVGQENRANQNSGRARRRRESDETSHSNDNADSSRTRRVRLSDDSLNTLHSEGQTNVSVEPLSGFLPLPTDPSEPFRYFFLTMPQASVSGQPEAEMRQNIPNFLQSFINNHLRRGQAPPEEVFEDPTASSTIIVRVARVDSPSGNDSTTGVTLQWTVYIMVPNQQSSAPAPPTSDPMSRLTEQQRILVERAVQFIRTVSAGAILLDDPNSYERLLRLQELLGIVNQGVSKELIDTQLPDVPVEMGSTIAPCSICLEEYKEDERVRHLPCHHFYHVACIDTWLGTRNTCPICRQEPVHRESSQQS